MPPRIPYVVPEQAPEDLKPIYDKVKAATGRVSNFVQILAHFPKGMSAVMGLLTALREGKLDPKLRELAYLKASWLNGCHY